MKAITLAAATPKKISNAGNRNFINIQNNDAADVYACYDGGQGDAGVNLDDTTGWVIPANGGTLFISNDGNRNVYTNEVWLYSVAGAAGTVRVQGSDLADEA